MKKILILVISIIIVLSTLGISFAGIETTEDPDVGAIANVKLTAEKANFSVTVPTSMPVLIKANGDVIGGTAKIFNNSAAPIRITGVKALPDEGWTLVAGNADLKDSYINSKKIGLIINNIIGLEDGSFQIDDLSFPVINVGGEEALTWSGIATSFEEAQEEMSAATVVYTVVFAK